MSLHKPSKGEAVQIICACAVIAAGCYVLAGFLFTQPGPIMACDPATQLRQGMKPAEVEALCGKPDNTSQYDADWYPLRGDTRENKDQRREFTWRYGSITSRTRNVNLYFRRGVLDSVQIFGDYK